VGYRAQNAGMSSSLFVKLPGQGTCVFNLAPEDSTVHGLIDAVTQKKEQFTGVVGLVDNRHEEADDSSLRIKFGSKTLHYGGRFESDQTLRSLGIGPGSTLEVTVPLRGGATAGKAVKGRSKSKAGMSDDMAAKMRWLQEQAAKRMLAWDALKAVKDKASEEAGLTRLNQRVVMEAMRKLMRDEKLSELQKEIGVLQSLHEDAVRRKDGIIARLVDNHDFAFDQHTAAYQAHVGHMERLIKLQDQRLMLIERQFEADLKVLVDEFDDEREEILTMHRDEGAELGTIYGAIENEEREEEEHAIGDLATLKQECREKREDAIDDLRSVLDGRLELIQDAFENAHLEYLERTDKRVSDFKHYTRINREREKDIERAVRGIERLQLQMQEIRNNMQLAGRKFQDQRDLLTSEKGTIQQQVSELRDKMRRFQTEQRSRRAGLASNADKCKKTLEERIGLAERILGLGEMARKKETEREKVQPFFILEEETAQMESEIASGGEVDPSSVLKAAHPLGNFHKKYNKALAESLVVQNERERLRKENDQLMLLLKQVQDGLVVNDEVLASQNPLFVINGRSNIVQQQQHQTLPTEMPVELKSMATVHAVESATQARALA